MHALAEISGHQATREDGKAASGPNKWSDFGVRLASSVILGTLALLALWRGGLAWQIAIYLALIGLGHEWARLNSLKLGVVPYLLLSPGLFIAACIGLIFGWLAGLLALVVLAALLAAQRGWFVAAGIPYAGLSGLALLWLRLVPADGRADTLFLVSVVWATDIGAYLVGRIFGGRKLAPVISPGKTWSGALGGLVFAALCGLALGDMKLSSLALAMLLSLCAQSGDLLESAIKRRLGVKDSGHTIPGHGGLFDRVDGFLAAAPVAALLVILGAGSAMQWR